MRRLISYISLASAMIIGAGVAVSPTILNMNTDAAYRDGKTFTFRISDLVEDPYGNIYDYSPDNTEIALQDPTNLDQINYVVKEFRSRLDNWGLSSYSIDTIGHDTVKVTLRTNNNDMTEYGYVQRYLTLSGGDFEIDASKQQDLSKQDLWAHIIDYENAWIEYIEQGGVASFPVVIVPLKDTKGDSDFTTVKNSFMDLVNYCVEHTTEANEDEGTQADICSLVIWANKKDTDSFDAISGENPDINVASRILAAVSCSNNNAVWYAKSDEEMETPYLQIIPNSDAISSGSYDPSKAGTAYSAARFLLNSFHASEYKIGNEKLLITYLYDETVNATVEDLFAYSYTQNLAWSSTLIASLIAFVLMAIVLVIFERLFALQIVSIAFLTTYLTLGTFVLFGAQFNIAALFGLLVVAFISTFQGIVYSSKVKDELYKGRTIKKAHQEGVKKSTIFTVDSSLISIILGTFTFFFAGDVVAKAGTILVFGGFISLITSSILNRILGWMLATDATAQAKFPKWLNIDKDKIADPLKEEKQSYFGPYEKKNFAKGKLIALVATIVFMVAGVIAMPIFASHNNGNVFNDGTTKEETTAILVEIKSTKEENLTKVANISDFVEKDVNDNVVTTSDAICNLIMTTDGKCVSELVKDVLVGESSKSIYDSSEEMSYYYFYFTVLLDGDYSDPQMVFTVHNNEYSLSDATREAIESYGLTSDFNVSCSLYRHETGTPDFGNVLLALGIGIAVSTVYLMIRFGLGKGLTAGLFAFGANYATLSFFTFTRISATPIISLGAIGTSLIVFMLAIAVFNKAKEMSKDSREKDKTTLEFKENMLSGAVNRSAVENISFALVAAYAMVSFFAFGPASYANIYLVFILGLAFAIALTLTSLSFTSSLFTKLFSKIHIKLPERKKKKLGQLSSNKNSSEPEEAIFIGIND